MDCCPLCCSGVCFSRSEETIITTFSQGEDYVQESLLLWMGWEWNVKIQETLKLAMEYNILCLYLRKLNFLRLECCLVFHKHVTKLLLLHKNLFSKVVVIGYNGKIIILFCEHLKNFGPWTSVLSPCYFQKEVSNCLMAKPFIFRGLID